MSVAQRNIAELVVELYTLQELAAKLQERVEKMEDEMAAMRAGYFLDLSVQRKK